MTDYKEVRTTQHEAGQEQRIATFKATQLIWLLLGLLEGAIALRVVFKLIAVNEANPFAVLLYKVTDFFVAPFASLTGAPAVGGMVLEISSIIAMIVYLLIAWALERIVYVLFYRPRGPVSVRQTVIADHTPQQAPVDVSQTVTTERTSTQTPTGVSQTTDTESTTT
jgi:YggT family protein